VVCSVLLKSMLVPRQVFMNIVSNNISTTWNILVSRHKTVFFVAWYYHVYGCLSYKTGFGLDDWIYCTLYIHIVRDYGELQRSRYSTHFLVHRYTRTRILRLH
jgi:hypothetical protein